MDGFLSPPIRARSITAAVRKAGWRGETMPRGVAVGTSDLAEALGAALARTAADGVLVPVELAAVVPVLALALCGDAGAGRRAPGGQHQGPQDPAERKAASAARRRQR